MAGLHAMAVVTTDWATLVVPLADSQRVKELVAVVAEECGRDYA